MPFPEVTRVIYKKNPLDRVICQLRFPPILRIDADVPADFQERVRQDYPNFSEKPALSIEMPELAQGQIPPEILREVIRFPEGKNYEFSSEDDQWKINLTHSFVALTTGRYQRWEDFRTRLVSLLDTLIQVYSPAYYARIGLRYVNVIRRSWLGLDHVDWSELLQPYILGILGSPQVGEQVQTFESTYDILLSDQKSRVRVATSFVEAADNGEKCYLVDSDFFSTEKTGIGEAAVRLDFFNQRASRLIQWCITPRLHEAMEPEPLC